VNTRLLAEQLVRHAAEGGTTEIGKWWDTYKSPFVSFGRQAFGKDGNFGKALGTLTRERPKTMLTAAGLGLGGVLGAASGSEGSVPRWMLLLGLLGLGGGYAYGKRNAVSNWVRNQFVTPALDDFEKRVVTQREAFDKSMNEREARLKNMVGDLEGKYGPGLRLVSSIANKLPR
jgi:hypothetical protein